MYSFSIIGGSSGVVGSSGTGSGVGSILSLVDLTTSEDNPVISIYNGVVLEVIEQGEKGCIVVVDSL